MPKPYLLLGLSIAMLIVLIGWLVLADHRASRVAAPIDREITLEQQLQLLSHKVVVLSARQSDEQALRRELMDLKEKMRRIEEALKRQRREADRVDTKPGAGAAITPGGVYPNAVDSSSRRRMRSTRMHGVINSCFIEENDSQATYLPVAEAGTEEEGEILAVTTNPLSTDDSVKRFLSINNAGSFGLRASARL